MTQLAQFWAHFGRDGAEVCGMAAMEDGVLSSDGLGARLAIRAGQAVPLARYDCGWDNHIVTI